MKNIWERLLLKMCSGNWEKLKFIHNGFWFYIKKQGFFNINIRNKFMIGISWLVFHEVCIHVQYFFGVVRNKLKLLLELNKRRSKVQGKNMSCERALDFDQWKTVNESAIFACLQIYLELLSLVTFLRFHSRGILPWQNTYPNLKTTCHIKLKFFVWTKLPENLLFAKYFISVAAPLIY